jgi:hypothetical protein
MTTSPAAVESALVTLYSATTRDTADSFPVAFPDVPVGPSPGTALNDVAGASFATPIELFAGTQALVLGTRYHLTDGAEDVHVALHDVAGALLEQVGVTSSSSPDDLVDLVGSLSLAGKVSAPQIEKLALIFGPQLEVDNTVDGQVTLTGDAASFATMVTELASNNTACRTFTASIAVGGVMKDVIFVEVDVCTSIVFDKLQGAIDPTHWPACNPFFISVTPVTQQQTQADGWAGVVREEVGPGLNGSVYTTDLAVRYLHQPGLATVAFDLAPHRNDDGRVSVDRGFVSATDEGAHRRVRTVKVYRIDDLNTPQSWICPLWAQQVAMAGWWCS